MYVLPYGQMSLWGIFMPEMCDIYLWDLICKGPSNSEGKSRTPIYTEEITPQKEIQISQKKRKMPKGSQMQMTILYMINLMKLLIKVRVEILKEVIPRIFLVLNVSIKETLKVSMQKLPHKRVLLMIKRTEVC